MLHVYEHDENVHVLTCDYHNVILILGVENGKKCRAFIGSTMCSFLFDTLCHPKWPTGAKGSGRYGP